MFGSDVWRRRPLLLVATLLLVLVGADRIAAVVLGKLVLHSHNRIAQVYAGKVKTDVLLMGNSVADAMVTTSLLHEATGLKVYTMAVHGLDARTQLIFTRALLQRNPAPRYAVMEVRSASDRDVIAREFAMFGQESPDLIGLAEEESPSVIPWRRVSALYNFNSRNLPSVLSRVLTGSDQTESGSDGRITEAKKRRFVERKLSVNVDSRALAAFVETVRLLQDHGTTVVVVAAPMHPVTRELGDWADRYAATVKAALPSGVRFVNSLRLFTSDADFEDPVHMNAGGRRAFAPVLARQLVLAPSGEQ